MRNLLKGALALIVLVAVSIGGAANWPWH